MINFEADTVSAIEGTPITFNSLPEGNPVSYSWSFNNGTYTTTSTEANPVVTFTNQGTYDVTLTTTYSDGLVSSLTIEDYIEVNPNDIDYTLAPNSYIFDPFQDNYDGLYIPVKKAYDMWANENGYLNTPITENNLSAVILWQDVSGLIISDENTPANFYDLPIIGNGSNAKIKVLVNKTKGEGNAVIAFKVAGEVKWSWHIWVTDTPEIGAANTVLQSYNKNLDGDNFAPTFMDRNLGATDTHFLGNEWNKSGGLMYQWGRKDPFPPLIYKDYTFYEVEGDIGIVKYHISRGEATLKMKDDFTILRPYDDINNNIKYSINNPFNYIYNQDNSSWFSSSPNLGPIPEH
ncbi:MAG: PKD domain-containing protein [Moheibacter sp.]